MSRYLIALLGAVLVVGCAEERLPSDIKDLESLGYSSYWDAKNQRSVTWYERTGPFKCIDGKFYDAGYDSLNKFADKCPDEFKSEKVCKECK